MLTLTAGQIAAKLAPTVRFQTLVALNTTAGRYYFAREAVTWNGNIYQARLIDEPRVELSITDGVQPTSEPVVTLTFADADGWFASREAGFFRQQSLSAIEAFLDVVPGVRELIYVVTETRVIPGGRFEIVAESALAGLRRQLIPGDAALITRARYPRLSDTTGYLNKPIPVVVGQLLAPAFQVDDVGTPSFPNETWWAVGVRPSRDFGDTEVFQVFNEATSRVESAVDLQMAQPLLQAAVHQASPTGSPAVPHFIRWLDNAPTLGPVTIGGSPAANLLTWLTNSVWGANLPASVVDTPSFAVVNSYHSTINSFAFAGAITEQIPVRTLLDEWLRDSATYLTERDGKLYLSVQRSRAAVASFSDATIVAQTLVYRDLPLEQEFSRWRVQFHDKTAPGRAAYALAPDRTEEFAAGSGAVFDFTSRLLGDPYDAQKLIRLGARRAAAGRREYQWQTTVKMIEVEPGDLVTLTASRWGLAARLCEVWRTDRQGALITVTARTIDPSVFATEPPNLPAPLEFQRLDAFVPILPASSVVLGPGQAETHTAAFSLSLAPTVVTQLDLPPIFHSFQSSLTATAPSSATIRIANTGTTSAEPSDYLYGWRVTAVP